MKNKLIQITSLYSKLCSRNKTSYVMNDANLIINKGSSIGIVGESGSGKTQFLKTITGTQEMIPGITNGTVTYFLDNQEIPLYDRKGNTYKLNKKHKEIKRDVVGFIPQDPKSSLNPYWTLEELFLQSYKIKKREISLDDFLDKYMSQVDMDSSLYKNKYPHQLSGGEAQRIMIAFIMSKEPQLIIADESSTGLDVSRQKKIIDSFKKIRSLNPDLTMIFISHDFGFLSHVVDEYYVLYGGFICEHITDKNQFFDLDNLHPYTRDLMSSLIPGGHKSNVMHDEIAYSLLTNPLKGCPYFNAKCDDSNCTNELHFHQTIPPMYDDEGKDSDIDLNGRWKRSRL